MVARLTFQNPDHPLVKTGQMQIVLQSCPVKPCSTPDVSDFGTRLRSAIESDAKYTLTCGFCLNYLRQLNKTLAPDADAICAALQYELKIPEKCRHADKATENMNRSTWLRSIVDHVLKGELA